MHDVIKFQSVRSRISMGQLFSFTCPSKLGPSVGAANSVAHLSDRKNEEEKKRKSGEGRQEILSFVRDKSGCWRTSVPDERKPRRDQRRSLSQKRKEQGFRVVEMSETPFDDPSHAENEEKYKKNIWEI